MHEDHLKLNHRQNDIHEELLTNTIKVTVLSGHQASKLNHKLEELGVLTVNKPYLYEPRLPNRRTIANCSQTVQMEIITYICLLQASVFKNS